jgi:flagellar protein FlaG
MNPLSPISGNPGGAYQTLSTVQEVSARPVVEEFAVVPEAKPNTNLNIDKVTEPTREAIEVAAQQIQHFLTSMERQVQISKDSTTGYISVKIINPSSGEVIRTLPSDELLRIARSFEQLGNVMVDQKA